MKKLSLYSVLVSLLITVLYAWNVSNASDMVQFIKATCFALVSEIGLWCTYYYARDYEACKAHEARQQQLKSFFSKVE